MIPSGQGEQAGSRPRSGLACSLLGVGQRGRAREPSAIGPSLEVPLRGGPCGVSARSCRLPSVPERTSAAACAWPALSPEPCFVSPRGAARCGRRSTLSPQLRLCPSARRCLSLPASPAVSSPCAPPRCAAAPPCARPRSLWPL